MKTVNIDFFKLDEVHHTKLVKVLGALHNAVQESPTSARLVDGKYVKTMQSNSSTNRFEFELVRVRMDSLPTKVALKGGEEELQFTEEEGIGEHTAILYSRKHRTLLIQRTRSGVSHSLFLNYINAIGKVDPPIEMRVILNENAMDVIRGLRDVKKMTLKASGISGGIGLSNDNVSVGYAARMADQLCAPDITIVASVGRSKSFLDGSNVFDSVSSFFSEFGSRATDISVTGKNPDNVLSTVHLLKYAVEESIKVDVSAGSRRASYDTISGALRQAFTNRKKFLDEHHSEHGE